MLRADRTASPADYEGPSALPEIVASFRADMASHAATIIKAQCAQIFPARQSAPAQQQHDAAGAAEAWGTYTSTDASGNASTKILIRAPRSALLKRKGGPHGATSAAASNNNNNKGGRRKKPRLSRAASTSSAKGKGKKGTRSSPRRRKEKTPRNRDKGHNKPAL